MEKLLRKHPVIEEMLSLIEAECKLAITGRFEKETLPLRNMLLYHMGWESESYRKKGKRIRPLLVCLSSHLAGGDWRCVLPAAGSLELIHNFSLIHDDIQDQSTTRHGRETLWVKFGIAQAINAGDALFSLALDEIWNLTSTYPQKEVGECSHLLTTTSIRLTEGQYLDIDFENRQQVTPDEYFAMVSGKTTALIEVCTQIGALLGSSNREVVEHFRLYGKYLGLAFQIVDDYLGIWGDAALTGKSNSSDLVSGKMSYPVVLALSLNNEFAARWRRKKISPDELPDVLQLLENSGINELTKAQALESTQLAFRHLEKAASSHPDYEILTELTSWLLQRVN